MYNAKKRVPVLFLLSYATYYPVYYAIPKSQYKKK